MQDIFGEYLDKFIIVYLDDILIYSTDRNTHIQHLRQTLETLRRNEFYAKLSKCEFFKTEVEYLGFRIGIEGLKVDPKKIEAVAKFPLPTDIHQLRSFLGMANYYRTFIKGFSTIAAPLTALLKKGIFIPEELNQEAFENIKQLLCKPPVLKIAEPELPYTVTTDASTIALGAVLSQEHHPIAYHSRKLNGAEKNYAAHELEMLAIVEAFRTWRHYLEGAKQQITVLTDHQSLKYMETQPTLTRRQAKWMEYMAQYNYKILYQPGKTNSVADALSRAQINAITMLRSHLEDQIKESQLEHGDSIPLEAQPVDGIYKINNLIFIPDDRKLRTTILQEVHDSELAGHPGREKTFELLRRHFMWSSLFKDVQDYVKTCDICQRFKPTNQRPSGLLQPLPVPIRNWESISLDLITQLPMTRNQENAIVVFVDRLSKMAHFIATTTQVTAPELANIFLTEIVRLHGMPTSIISDRDPRFTSNFWKAFFKMLNTKLQMSTAYHPQTDGQTERTNRTLEQYLRIYSTYKQDNWAQLLPLAEFAYNNHTNATTKESPFYLNYGFHPSSPIILGITQVKTAQETLELMQGTLKQAIDNIKKAQQNQKEQADKTRRNTEFQEGDLVYLAAEHILTPEQRNRPTKKLQPRYLGPFRILEIINPVAYKLELPEGYKIHNVFHASLLKKHNISNEEQFPKRSKTEPQPVQLYQQPEWEIEEILDTRITRKGQQHQKEYLIKWKDYPLWDATWEPEKNLKHAQEILQEWKLNHPESNQ